MKFVTQTDIASELGISRSAVAKAFHSRLRTQLSPQRYKTILATAERLGYRPHRHAQLMRGKKSGVIGIIKPTHSIQSAAERSFHASKSIYEAGYGLTANEILWSDKGFKLGVDAMLDAHVEGVLLVGITGEADEVELRRLCNANIPVVSLAGNQWAGIPYVIADHQQGMMDVTKHMLGFGYRQITFVTTVFEDMGGPPSSGVLKERLTGFQKAVAATGLSDEDARVIQQTVPRVSFDSFLPGKVAMRRILERDDRPRAIVFGNDYLAIGAMAVCAEKGVRIPGDVAIAGFDDTTQGQHVWPPLTTVAQPNEEVATKAVELLLKLVRGEKLSVNEESIKVPCRLVVRQSCGAGRQESKTQ